MRTVRFLLHASVLKSTVSPITPENRIRVQPIRALFHVLVPILSAHQEEYTERMLFDGPSIKQEPRPTA